MAFKGIIKRGTRVGITLCTRNTNQHTGVLLAGLGAGPGGSEHAVVAPGACEPVGLGADQDSILEITVHFEKPDEGGHLEVKVDGTLRDSEDVNGQITTWLYSVE